VSTDIISGGATDICAAVARPQLPAASTDDTATFVTWLIQGHKKANVSLDYVPLW
jgi:hypothetical protein